MSTLFSPSRFLLPYFGASTLYGLAVGIGALLLIVPGIYLGLKYQFYGELIVDKKMGAVEALKKSAEMTEGMKWSLLGFVLAVLGVNVLGALALGVGLLETIPVTILAYFMVYRKLSARLILVVIPAASTLLSYVAEAPEKENVIAL